MDSMNPSSASKMFSAAGELAAKIIENQEYHSSCLRRLYNLVNEYYKGTTDGAVLFHTIKSPVQMSVDLVTFSNRGKMGTRIDVELFVICNVITKDDSGNSLAYVERRLNLGDFFEYFRRYGEYYINELTPKELLPYHNLYAFYRLNIPLQVPQD